MLNVLRKLEKPIDLNNQNNERTVVPEINFLETKREVEELFKKIEEIKKSNLSPKEKTEESIKADLRWMQAVAGINVK